MHPKIRYALLMLTDRLVLHHHMLLVITLVNCIGFLSQFRAISSFKHILLIYILIFIYQIRQIGFLFIFLKYVAVYIFSADFAKNCRRVFHYILANLSLVKIVLPYITIIADYTFGPPLSWNFKLF